jgi:hypothetical protein
MLKVSIDLIETKSLLGSISPPIFNIPFSHELAKTAISKMSASLNNLIRF